MVKLNCLLDDGSISQDVMIKLCKVNKFIKESFNDVEISNGNSYVFISNTCNNVYQYYKYDFISEDIFKLMSKINKKKRNKIYFEENKIEYDIFDYLSQFVSYIPKNIIVWKRHFCLNMLDKNYLEEFIEKNIFKLIWDICKALNGLHNMNIYHGDCRLDNVGIYNGNFILFDFDASKQTKTKEYNLMEKDLYDFISSIKFNSGKKLVNIVNVLSNEYYSSFYIMNNLIVRYKTIINRSYKETIKYLDNMCIEK